MKPGMKILFSMHIAAIVFLSANLVIGEFGIVEKRKLLEYRDVLALNITELYSIGTNLETHSVSLRTDPDRVGLLARQLGYCSENEILLKIDGYDNSAEPYSIGKTMTRIGSSGQTKTIIRTCAGISGVLAFLFLSLFRKKNDGHKRV